MVPTLTAFWSLPGTSSCGSGIVYTGSHPQLYGSTPFSGTDATGRNHQLAPLHRSDVPAALTATPFPSLSGTEWSRACPSDLFLVFPTVLLHWVAVRSARTETSRILGVGEVEQGSRTDAEVEVEKEIEEVEVAVPRLRFRLLKVHDN